MNIKVQTNLILSIANFTCFACDPNNYWNAILGGLLLCLAIVEWEQ